jgi:putative nucleotidyltransferase with HDIG domain
VVEIEEIKQIFSKELQWIEDETIKEKVAAMWKKAADQGGWTNLDEVPFTLLFKNSGKLIDHTKRVTKLSKLINDVREEKLKQDILIAGALLHDVGKLLEYQLINGKIIKGDYGEKFRHPVSGSLLAKSLDLPDDIIFIIYAHSHEGDKCQRTPESFIVHHCDFIDFHIRKSLE